MQGQFYLGVKGSYSIPFNRSLEIKYDDAQDFFIYQVEFLEQDYTPTLSLVGYYRQDLVYFQSELGYKRAKTRFRANNYIDLDNITSTINVKTTHSIDVPVIAGVRIDRFKLGVGPTFSFILSDNEIFTDTDFFEEKRNFVETGFGFHFGILLYRLHVDVSYQYRFNEIGDYLYWRKTHQGFSQAVRYLDIGLGLYF